MPICKKCGGDHHIILPDGRVELCECIAPDPVNSPPYYTKNGVECIDAVRAAGVDLNGFEGHLTGSALQYLWRWQEKNGIEDLYKAKWFLDRLIAEADG